MGGGSAATTRNSYQGTPNSGRPSPNTSHATDSSNGWVSCATTAATTEPAYEPGFEPGFEPAGRPRPDRPMAGSYRTVAFLPLADPARGAHTRDMTLTDVSSTVRAV